jgi:UDP-N-acetylglucosamine diphosphorylase/glucosamine-1-phosphate N-acetyltransferase
MNVVIYESDTESFFPLIDLYPQYDLRIGLKTVTEHAASLFPKARIRFLARDQFKLKKPVIHGPAVYLSAQALMLERWAVPRVDTRLVIGSHDAGFVRHAPPFPITSAAVKQIARTIKHTHSVEGIFLETPMDIVKYNEKVMSYQFRMMRPCRAVPKKITIIGNKKALYLMPDTQIDALSVIDVSHGPVLIEKGAVVKPFSVICGPSYIGAGTIVDRAKIIGSSIGPRCRVGGEIEGCVFQGFSNKYHEGFIGHSFVGEWVNLGALTTNSDLKNNYGEVRIMIKKKKINTGMIKCGCFIGDHTKTGIGTLISTGAVIGCFVNFFGGGMMPRYVPRFRWLSTGSTKTYILAKALETARTVMKRRNVVMSEDYEGLIRRCYRWRNSS